MASTKAATRPTSLRNARTGSCSATAARGANRQNTYNVNSLIGVEGEFGGMIATSSDLQLGDLDHHTKAPNFLNYNVNAIVTAGSFGPARVYGAAGIDPEARLTQKQNVHRRPSQPRRRTFDMDRAAL